MTELTLTLITEAEIEYRSSSPEPDSWCSALAQDENGKQYKVWFKMDPAAENLEDACDWDSPDDYEEV